MTARASEEGTDQPPVAGPSTAVTTDDRRPAAGEIQLEKMVDRPGVTKMGEDTGKDRAKSREEEDPSRESSASNSSMRRKKKRPFLLAIRTSGWYITSVVAIGVASDALTYNIVVPVLPYRLQSLGYTNVSGLVSWLLFSYSAGIFIATFPAAWFFHKHPWRRGPLVIGVLVLAGALILFMLARPYWVMVLSRFLMGAASVVIWTVGFALICENVEEKNIGRQIGWAVSGVSVGTTIAPPIGGALYWHLGWRAPFIFCIGILFVDLIARILVIERKDLVKYEDVPVDLIIPARAPVTDDEAETAADTGDKARPTITEAARREDEEAVPREAPRAPVKELSPWGVLVALGKSPRSLNGFLMTFVFGILLGVLDPTLTLRVEETWNKNSDFVGLVYLAASAPSFVTGPIVGALADKFGAEWIMAPSLTLVLPWLPLMILKRSLPGFIVFFALTQTFLSCALGPVGLEVAMAARAVEGMSEIHQFAAMNLSFAVSTSIGAVIGGQMYDRLSNGWTAVCWFCFAFCLACLPFPVFAAGNRTLWTRLGRKEHEIVEDARVLGAASVHRA